MRIGQIIAGLMVACVPFDAAFAAPIVTGNQLYEACTTSQGTAHLGCSGYVIGVADTLMTVPSAGETPICFPDGYTAEQLADVALKFLVQYPEQRAKSAALMVIAAFVQAFPC